MFPDLPPAAAVDFLFLRRGQWFGNLPPPLQQAIVQRSVVRDHPKGARIVSAGVLSHGLFVLLEGRVHVLRSAGTLMHVGEAGFWFGEYSLLSGSPAIADIVAATGARTRFLPVAEFDRLVADEPARFRAFVSLLIDRYAIALRQMSDIKRLSAEERVLMQLENLVALRRLDVRGDGPVDISLSQAELASMVGLSRQTLCALLGRLQDRGLVEVSFRRLRMPGTQGAPQPPVGIDDGGRRGTANAFARRATPFDSRLRSAD